MNVVEKLCQVQKLDFDVTVLWSGLSEAIRCLSDVCLFVCAYFGVCASVSQFHYLPLSCVFCPDYTLPVPGSYCSSDGPEVTLCV